jgi:hypothetical protein
VELISSEKKIDRIESRLGNIEQLLQTLASSTSSRDISRSRHITPSASTIGESSTIHNADDDTDSDSAFDGDSAIAAHAVYVTKFLDSAVDRVSLQDMNPNMNAAISSLQQIMGLLRRHPSSRVLKFQHQQVVPPGGLAELTMPPMHVVVAMLKRVKGLLMYYCNERVESIVLRLKNSC